MRKDLSEYSFEEKEKIAKRAKRKIHSECTLILTAGFATLMVTLFFFGNFTFLPVAIATGIRPTVVWVLMSAGISAAWALLHYLWAGPRISAARALDAAFAHQYQAARRKEREEKFRNINLDE